MDVTERWGKEHCGLQGKRVLVLRLARQGTALARFLLSQGAAVTITDMQQENALQDAIDELQGLPIRYALGGHPTALLDDADMVCLSGGVPPTVPIVGEALRRGIPLSNDAQLTLECWPGTVIGITGSSGKTTTTTLAGLMLNEAGIPSVVGGNIGTPLIDRIEGTPPGSRGIMELSSFQLELCSRSPQVAAVINVTPNHLDRHRTMAAYTGSKANILRWQTADDVCVLSADDSITSQWWEQGYVAIPAETRGKDDRFTIASRRLGFSVRRELDQGAFVQGRRLMLRLADHRPQVICSLDRVRLRGMHNVANVLAASLLAAVAECPTEAMEAVATTFTGVEHRLEPVRELHGVVWINDSIATSPERSVAAIESFHEPLLLLAGGRDKSLPWEDWARLVVRRVKNLLLFGEAAEMIEGTVRTQIAATGSAASRQIFRCRDLGEAVAAAHSLAEPGDVVLLAPGCTSFDAYKDFAARGEHFRRLVLELERPAC